MSAVPASSRQPKAEVVIHLGDGEDDAAAAKLYFPQKMFLQVCGNCDWGSTLPPIGEITLEGKKIFYTHGHMYGVKLEYDYRTLREKGASVNADLIVFGHTHKPYCDWDGHALTVNPGSAGLGRTYAVASIENGKVRADIKEIK